MHCWEVGGGENAGTPAQPCPPGAPETAQGFLLISTNPPARSVSILSLALVPGSTLRMLEVRILGRLTLVVSWVSRTKMGGEDRCNQEVFPCGFDTVQLDRHPEEEPRVTVERAAQMPSLPS